MFHDSYAGFQYSTLPNGLSLYVQERSDVSWFYTGVVVHAGAKEDSRGREGLAHYVEMPECGCKILPTSKQAARAFSAIQ